MDVAPPILTQRAGLHKGAWSPEEDALLRKCIDKFGVGKWGLVPGRAGLNRCRKSCRLRWLNYLSPGIKRGSFSEEEDDLIIRLHKLLGNRWSLIAGRIPGRTANDIKNYWNTHLSRRIDGGHKRESASSSSEVIKPRPKTIPKNWVWSEDKTEPDRRREGIISDLLIRLSPIEENSALVDNEAIKEWPNQAMSPAEFMMTDLDVDQRIKDLLELGDEEMFLGDIGGWEDLVLDINFS